MPAAPSPNRTRPPSLRAAAAECLRQSPDYDAATGLLAKRLRTDPTLEPHLRQYAYDAIRLAARDERRDTERAVLARKEHAAADMARSNARLHRVRSMLDEWRLPGGKLLGDATIADLRDAARVFSENARRNDRKATFVERVLKRTRKGTVRKSLSEESIQKLWREVAGEDESDE